VSTWALFGSGMGQAIIGQPREGNVAR
jgi:hypothetical protein